MMRRPQGIDINVSLAEAVALSPETNRAGDLEGRCGSVESGYIMELLEERVASSEEVRVEQGEGCGGSTETGFDGESAVRSVQLGRWSVKMRRIFRAVRLATKVRNGGGAEVFDVRQLKRR